MPKKSNPFRSGARPTSAAPASPLAYSIEDAAEAIGLSRSRLYELLGAGEIAACKVGKRTIIPVGELTAFLERHRVERLPDGRAAPRQTTHKLPL